MRLDKYLKVARLIKRRTQAKLLADYDKITINGKLAKPATQVAVGDVIAIVFGANVLSVKVTQLSQQAKKEEAALMYEIIAREALDS